jgi:hypothetical protein
MIEFTVQGSTGEWIPRTVDDVRSQAIAFMTPYFVVESVGVTRTSNAILREYWDFGYDANVRVRTLRDHSGIVELTKIVADAFTYAAGEPATAQAPAYERAPYPGGQPGGTTEPPSAAFFGLGLFGLAAIAVAIVVWKHS